MIRGKPFVYACAAILGLVALAISGGPAGAQQIRNSGNGAVQVVFGNGCVVYYDYAGRRTHHEACALDQVRRADAVMADAAGGSDGPPVVTMTGNGAQVSVGAGCIVYYDRSGQRTSHSSCGAEQLRLADRSMVGYRHEQTFNSGGGWNGYNPGWSGYDRDRPRVIFSGNGSGRIVFPDRCVVFYNSNGRQISHQSCGRDQLVRADRTMAAYRQGQWLNGGGTSGGGYGGSFPRVSISGNGSGRVLLGNNCLVLYNSAGARTSHESCGSDELRRADQAMASYRREQGLGSGYTW